MQEATKVLNGRARIRGNCPSFSSFIQNLMSYTSSVSAITLDVGGPRKIREIRPMPSWSLLHALPEGGRQKENKETNHQNNDKWEKIG